MQTTWYSLMASKDRAHWVELTPRPRSRRGALKFFELVKEDEQYPWLQLERVTHSVDIIKRVSGA